MNFKNIIWFIKAIINSNNNNSNSDSDSNSNFIITITTIITIIIITIIIIIIIIKFNLSFVSGTHISMDLEPEKFLSQVDYKC